MSLGHYKVSDRYRRRYSPDGLMIIRGPKDSYKTGAQWIVGDTNGYAELLLMPDSKSYHKNTIYIENFFVKENSRGRGFGRELYFKIEKFAQNIGAEFIQIDSEMEVIGFWNKVGFYTLDIVYYWNKKAMLKEI